MTMCAHKEGGGPCMACADERRVTIRMLTCTSRDLDDAESYRCELPMGHDGPHFNEWAEPDTEANPWERGGDLSRFKQEANNG